MGCWIRYQVCLVGIMITQTRHAFQPSSGSVSGVARSCGSRPTGDRRYPERKPGGSMISFRPSSSPAKKFRVFGSPNLEPRTATAKHIPPTKTNMELHMDRCPLQGLVPEAGCHQGHAARPLASSMQECLASRWRGRRSCLKQSQPNKEDGRNGL